jgi:aminoglycoside phosphotransferase (APT) family kinase protein
LNDTLQYILPSFSRYGDFEKINAFGNGLINNTWKLTAGDANFILQRINSEVFTSPETIDQNLQKIQQHLQQHYPAYFFVGPLANDQAQTLTFIPSVGYFRLMPFIEGSFTKDELTQPQQAWEAAAQFASFTARLQGINISDIKETIPSFHDLNLRFRQFQQALQHATAERLTTANVEIAALHLFEPIGGIYNSMLANPAFKKRIMHHDTKISNVLFDEQDRGICVIDLDTVMPGYFMSDVGDMMRTYLCPINEESIEWDAIVVRKEYYTAIVQGYWSQMGGLLTNEEKTQFFDAGCCMIYMQALRFLTDYLNGDVYYGARYPLHNLMRAKHQTILLQQLMKKEKLLKNISC